MKDTPLSFSDHPVISLSGSDQSKSQRRPQSGIYKVVQQKLTPSLSGDKSRQARSLGQTYVSWAHDTTYLLHRVQIRAETAVHCEDLLINNGCDRQAVEAVSEGFPQLNVVSSLALVVEAIDAVDGGAFVVTTENEKVFRVFDLVCQQKADRLQ